MECKYFVHALYGTTKLTDWLRGTQSLRSWHFLSWSINSLHFMEPEGSLPHSTEPATSPYNEADQFSPRPESQFLKTHLILSSHLSLGLSRRFPQQNSVYTSPTPHMCNASPITMLIPYNCIYVAMWSGGSLGLQHKQHFCYADQFSQRLSTWYLTAIDLRTGSLNKAVCASSFKGSRLIIVIRTIRHWQLPRIKWMRSAFILLTI